MKILIRKLKNIYHRLRAIAAVFYYRFPSRKLTVIGITGTDGKTTTSFYLYNILLHAGIKVAMISTIEARFGEKTVDIGLHVTNPDAWQLQKLLRQIVDEKMEYVIIEVTSHGIDQGRIFGIHFDYIGLTNITPEHLDYHKDFETYKKIKMDFVQSARRSFVTKNIDDSVINGIKVNLPGDFNRLNAKLAAAIAKSLKITDTDIKVGIESLQSLPGRMQTVYNGVFRVIVDFAHTPNGLENVMRSVRAMLQNNGRLISIFGSAGERDRKKRPIMGEIAAKYADFIIITAEDPRSEKVEDISQSIASGALKLGKVLDKNLYLIPDRKRAIEFALLNLAKVNDIVLLTGKGHEKAMNYGQGEVAWSDVDEVKLITDRL